MQCARRELDVLRPVPAGFYHRLRIAGSIVAIIIANLFFTTLFYYTMKVPI